MELDEASSGTSLAALIDSYCPRVCSAVLGQNTANSMSSPLGIWLLCPCCRCDRRCGGRSKGARGCIWGLLVVAGNRTTRCQLPSGCTPDASQGVGLVGQRRLCHASPHPVKCDPPAEKRLLTAPLEAPRSDSNRRPAHYETDRGNPTRSQLVSLHPAASCSQGCDEVGTGQRVGPSGTLWDPVVGMKLGREPHSHAGRASKLRGCRPGILAPRRPSDVPIAGALLVRSGRWALRAARAGIGRRGAPLNVP